MFTTTVTRPCLRYIATSLPRLDPRPTKIFLTNTLAKAHQWPRFGYGHIHLRLLSTLETTPESLLRKNKVDIQMLHPDLYRSVFPSSPSPASAAKSSGSSTPTMDPTPEMVKYAIEHLKKQNLWGKEALPVPNIAFPVPSLRGQNIEDHFYNIGVHDSATYKELAVTFAQSPTHPPPKQWLLRAGWTRYGKDGSVAQVEYPKEKVLTFDVETVPNLSKFPVMACAISSEAWYGWVSPWLIDPVTKDGQQNDHHLISFGPSRNRKGEEKILVGHNVGYDRARVQEEYSLEQNGIRYLDTMSLHIAVSGLCTQQRPGWLKYSKALENGDDEYVHEFKDTTGKYFDVSSVNSLLQVSKFHCNIHMDKAPRDILLDATEISQIRENFQGLMTYCGQDVTATNLVYQKILPKYFEKCPHPISFAGILQMGSSFLTVTEGWKDYIARCNKMHKEMSQSVESKLFLLAEHAIESLENDPSFYKSDPWLSQLDWNLPKREWKEGVMKVNGDGYLKGKEPGWSCRARLLPDKPEWYRALWDSKEKRMKLTTRQRVAPLLLKLQWRGYPLVYSDLHGWTFRVPKGDSEFTTKSPELSFPLENEAGYQAAIDPDHYRYYRVPHNSGEGLNVGNPLSKGYISHFEAGTLSSYSAEGASAEGGSGLLAKQALDMNAKCAYWVSARERIEDQFVVWDKEANQLGDGMGLPDRGEGRSSGMILPQIITMGTVTRRAVEKTWMTASNAKSNRIGSELKSMIAAPAGYKIVGADVDSEELWISSLMGDAQFRMHGATALGWMTLQGTKAAETDLHSKTAKILGITRDQAKVFNYGRIYGAGVKFAASLLQQFNSTIDALEAKQRATNLYSATKGIKQQRAENYELITDRPFWHGGTESYMFNSMERTATAEDPRTPALGCAITDALKPKYTENQFMTSRVNWVVQSSGVDYLHMLLVSMNYLIRKYDIKARFMLCVHDEVRYMVKEEDTARATLALQISNLWTRALFSYKLGIHDLPQSVAFFSCVDVDHVFRKEVFMDCLTPTQSNKIPHGTSLTIDDVLSLTQGGDLGKVAEGFQDATEDSFPTELRTLEERRKARLSDPDPSVDPSLLLEMSQEANDAHNMFLEAQGLTDFSEIKTAIKRRRAEAEAALLAKIQAEKAASGANSSDGESGQGSQGAYSKVLRVRPKEPRRVAALLPHRRVVTAAGSWGTIMHQPATTTKDQASTGDVKVFRYPSGKATDASEISVATHNEIPTASKNAERTNTATSKSTTSTIKATMKDSVKINSVSPIVGAAKYDMQKSLSSKGPIIATSKADGDGSIDDGLPTEDLLLYFRENFKDTFDITGTSMSTTTKTKPIPICEPRKSSSPSQYRALKERQNLKNKKIDHAATASGIWVDGGFNLGGRSERVIVDPKSGSSSPFAEYAEYPEYFQDGTI
ncbi:DNA-directed DNA polymerase gamma mip1 [Mortierella sp. AD094]|nr:DNA-directed DNA polymerase gamma mip1 [Mortierella sp. AD094]